jgi:hypothetical protein
MITLDYNRKILRARNRCKLFSTLLKGYRLFNSNWLLKRINNLLSSELKKVTSILVLVMGNQPALKDKMLRPHMQLCNEIHRLLYPMRGNTERALEKASQPELKKTLRLLESLIDVVHDIISVLRDYTIKIPGKYRSEEATIAGLRSQQTLGRILFKYENKPT